MDRSNSENPFCKVHKKGMMRFLMVKTAGVRSGIKSGELLRVSSCYRLRHSWNGAEERGCPREDTEICLSMKEILDALKLSFHILKQDSESALVLFYAPELLKETLKNQETARTLEKLGYTDPASLEKSLETLSERCRNGLSHEVGFFIGYPPKDVIGFLSGKTPEETAGSRKRKGSWRIFGEAEESLRLMELYRKVERKADIILKRYQDLETCLSEMETIQIKGVFQHV